jgi:hypothetical protein
MLQPKQKSRIYKFLNPMMPCKYQSTCTLYGSAVDPVSKKPLCMDGVYTNIQSRNNVFPTQILISKETKASYDSFKDCFDFFPKAGNKTINRENTPFHWDALQDFKELDLSTNIDMSAQWKGLQKGGACKQSHFFCRCCTVESKAVHHPNNVRCAQFCSDREDGDWQCYHHEIKSSQHIANMKDSIAHLQASLSQNLDTIEKESKANLFPENHRGRCREKASVDVYPSGADDLEEFTEFLYNELQLRSLNMTGTVEELLQHLKQSLQHENRLRTTLD